MARRSPLEKVKYRRRRRKIVFSLSLIVLAIIILAAAGWLIRTETFQIREIVVVGAVVIPERMIIDQVEKILVGDYFFIWPRRHIAWYPRREIEKVLLAQFPRLMAIAIQRSGLKTLTIEIKERTPVLLACAERCFFADAGGFIYAPAPIFSSSVYLVWELTTSTPIIGQTLAEQIIFNQLRTLISYLNQVFSLHDLAAWQAVKIFARGDGDYEIIFTDRRTDRKLPILIAVGEPATATARNLDLVFSQLLGTTTEATLPAFQYLDLRFGKKVFYKL